MSDFETRVRETLRAGSDGAPPAVGLAEAARRRWRKRRRTTAAVVASAVVLAAVPLGIALLGDTGSPGKKDDVVASALPDVPDGWRWESWRDIQIAVPGHWKNGPASQWCVSSDSNAGLVDRGEGFSTLAACSPGVSSSVTFREGLAKHPLIDIQGVGERLIFDGNTVDVVAPDQVTLDAIVASANQFEKADSRGCTPQIQDFPGRLTEETAGGLTVCRYTGSSDGYALTESRDLGDQESTYWLNSLAKAPDGGERSLEDPRDLDCNVSAKEAILVSSEAGPIAFLELSSCGGGYVETAGGQKEISEELTTPLGSEMLFGFGY